jgi:hypothetical protein
VQLRRRSPNAGTNDAPARRRVPFLGHQIAEYTVAIALIAVGFHLSGGAEIALAAAGILLLLLNVVTQGRVSAIGLLSRRAHHVGDFVVAAVLIVVPIFEYSRLHVGGVALAEGVALLVLWIERSTLYVDRPRPASEAVAEGDKPARRVPSGFETAGIVAGALALEAGKAARQAARRLGVVTGVTKRVVKQRRTPPGAGSS